MPQRFMQKDDISRKTYLNDIYDSIIIKDIVKRFNIKDIDLLNRIVTYILTDETVIDREFNVYKKIEDNYPKYVLSMDKFDLSQNGIIHKNIIDWLLKN